MTSLTEQDIWSALDSVTDPEIPIVSVVEMGIVREVKLDGDRACITITPTFVGCPALIPMREAIADQVRQLGVRQVEVRTSLNPPWSSEWIRDSARARLKTIGIPPPPHHPGTIDIPLLAASTCPYCGSSDTVLDSLFGPTPCRTLHFCNHCLQSYEQFKPL